MRQNFRETSPPGKSSSKKVYMQIQASHEERKDGNA